VASDFELVARSLVEPRCFEELVGLYGSRLHAYLARRSPGHADDLLSEVWLAAFEGRHRYDPALGGVVGWLFGIARNVLLAHHRGERRRATQVVGGLDDHVDEWAAVDARLDAAETAGALRIALAALPSEEREVLLLVAWEQLAPTEVATVLGIPPGTARSRLHRARARVSASWSEQHATDEPEREAIS
jgi:RNA polymerase sigma factor (sigma-70 family)